MNILSFNCGSSSLTYKIFSIDRSGNIEAVASGKAHRVGVKGTASSFLEHNYKGNFEKNNVPLKNHREAAGFILAYLKERSIKVDYIGHRFVHGGEYFKNSVILNNQLFKKLELCLPLAPIHNPMSLNVIEESIQVMPEAKNCVAFDSAFHSTIPYKAYTYALPKKIIKKFGFRKYGFHGLSYSYVLDELSKKLKIRCQKKKIVACHLGTGGSSVCAIKYGKSLDTSMGYTPLPGLVMSTRSGDVDPMLTLYIMSAYGYRADNLVDMLNKKSGLLAVSGVSSDIRDIIDMDSKNDTNARLAFEMYIHRLKKYIGSYIAAMDGIDLLVFTDDIGVHNPLIRQKVCSNMQWCGLELDDRLNADASGDKIEQISSKNSKVKAFVIPTDEEYVICLDVLKAIARDSVKG